MHLLFKSWLLLIGLLACCQVAEAMSVIPLQNEQGEHNISSIVEILEDDTGLLTFDQVLDPAGTLSWKSYPEDVPNFGFSNKVYWVRMRLQNVGEASEPWYLELAYPNHDKLEFFHEQADGSFTKREAGDRHPFAQRDLRYRNFVFKLDIPSGVTRNFYLRSKSESSMQFPLRVWTPTALAEKINREIFGLGIFNGIMVVIILYNLFIFFWLRNISYLYYVLYISCFSIYQAAIGGFLLEYVLPEQPDLVNYSIPVISSLACLFAMIFAMNFLQTSKHCPRFHKVLRFFLSMSYFFVGMALFASYSTSIRFGSVLIILAIPCILFASILSLRNGYRPARYFFAAWLALLSGVFIYHLYTAGFFPASFFTIYGNQIGSSVEVVLLSLALADKIKLEQAQNQGKIERLNTQLESNIRNVEHEVEEKTRDIKSILSNIRQGIFMILPPDFRIHKDHSSHLREILEINDIEQGNAMDLLFQHARLSPDEMNQVKSVLVSSLEQDEINFIINAHCLPHELVYRAAASGTEKTLRLDWSPIVGAENRIDKILVAIRDETHLKKLQAQTQTQQMELDYISQILEIPHDKFARFMETSYGCVEQNLKLIEGGSQADQESIRQVFIHTHTLKGMSRNYGFKQLTDVLHQAEAYLKKLQNQEAPYDKVQLQNDQNHIRSHLDLYVGVSVEKLGRRRSLHTVEFDLADVETMIQTCRNLMIPLHHETPLHAMHAILMGRIHTDAAEVLRKSCARAQRLARDLHKEEPHFEIEAEGFAFNRQGEQLMEVILTHLIRNSLDHGLETREQRLSFGKAAAGTISMKLKDVDGQLVLSYQDDGRGLSLAAIQEKAQALGLIMRHAKPNPQEIAELIFMPGLSTSSQVTDISGHGVGMDAVRSYLEQAGGSIHIQLLNDQHDGFAPFAFFIRLPSHVHASIPLKKVA
ncbi:7TM diverse intracellular signaling domain-containing protein [Oligoflexus tunisiensis]|uniref:7TM diverse intracellular signaling domain-containing protein n=1 Tax=Oligoflexus tunisiensis TaxID=708132 RepID=UPI000AC7D241|nr:7TM diverse intracellular signaling domain-containing protein [Oligoflexus tunisiensis]